MLIIRSQRNLYVMPFPRVSAHFLPSSPHYAIFLSRFDPSPSTPLWMLWRSKHNGLFVPTAALRRGIDISGHACFLRLKEIIRRGMWRGALTSHHHMEGMGEEGVLPLHLRESWGSHRDRTHAHAYAHINAKMYMWT